MKRRPKKKTYTPEEAKQRAAHKREVHRLWQGANADRQRANHRIWMQKNKVKILAQKARDYAKNRCWCRLAMKIIRFSFWKAFLRWVDRLRARQPDTPRDRSTSPQEASDGILKRTCQGIGRRWNDLRERIGTRTSWRFQSVCVSSNTVHLTSRAEPALSPNEPQYGQSLPIEPKPLLATHCQKPPLYSDESETSSDPVLWNQYSLMPRRRVQISEHLIRYRAFKEKMKKLGYKR